MYLEIKNLDTGKYYYVVGPENDLAAIIFSPGVEENLHFFAGGLELDTVFDSIRPLVDRLMVDNDEGDTWVLRFFVINDVPKLSLTESRATIKHTFLVGDTCYHNGERLPTKFHFQHTRP